MNIIAAIIFALQSLNWLPSPNSLAQDLDAKAQEIYASGYYHMEDADGNTISINDDYVPVEDGVVIDTGIGN